MKHYERSSDRPRGPDFQGQGHGGGGASWLYGCLLAIMALLFVAAIMAVAAGQFS